MRNDELLDLYTLTKQYFGDKIKEYEMGMAYVGKCEGRKPIWKTQVWVGE